MTINQAEEKLIKARIKLQSRNPFFSYLSLFIKFKLDKSNLPDNAGMGVYPDGTLEYKEDFVNNLNDEETIGVLCHEILHLAFLHLIRRGNREHEKWNIAVDLAVNSTLKENGFELPNGIIPENNHTFKFPMGFFKKAFEIIKVNTKTAEEIYEELPEMNKQNGGCSCGKGKSGSGKSGSGSGSGIGCDKCCKGFDEHKEKSEGKGTSKSEQQELENEWLNRLEEAYVSAKQRGRLPLGMERYIDEIKKSQINWKVMLQKLVQSTIPRDYTYCLDKDTKIKTLNGETKIKDLRKGRYVIGYKNGKLVKSKIKDKFSSKVEEEFIITTKSGKKIRCSSEHRILTESGYKKAKNLNIKDVVLTIGE